MRKFRAPPKATCLEIEELNRAISEVPESESVEIYLPRTFRPPFFAATTLAQCLSHHARRTGRLLIRDAYHDWTPQHSSDRFLCTIEGVVALVNNHMLDTTRVENARKASIPKEVFSALSDRLWRTGIIEIGGGPTRTFLAIDPTHDTPIEFGSVGVLEKSRFYESIEKVLSQYNQAGSNNWQLHQRALINLISFIYETFQNTYEHGRYNSDSAIISGIRFFRIRHYIDNKSEDLVSRASGFPELQSFLEQSLNGKQSRKLIELCVSDCGQGITSHFLNSTSTNISPTKLRVDALNGLVADKLTSKQKMSGGGLGLPNAMSALGKLEAFLSLRTEEFWMYCDFLNKSGTRNRILSPVHNSRTIAPMIGTQFNVLICLP